MTMEMRCGSEEPCTASVVTTSECSQGNLRWGDVDSGYADGVRH